jgi:hypothetical protein
MPKAVKALGRGAASADLAVRALAESTGSCRIIAVSGAEGIAAAAPWRTIYHQGPKMP